MPESFMPPVVAELGASTVGFTAGLEQAIALLGQFAAVAAEVGAQTTESFAAVSSAALEMSSVVVEASERAGATVSQLGAGVRASTAEIAAAGEAVPAAMGAVSGSVQEMAATSSAGFASVSAAAAEASTAMASVGASAAGMAAETSTAATAAATSTARVGAASATAAAESGTAFAAMGATAGKAVDGTASSLKGYGLALAGSAVGAIAAVKGASDLQAEIVRLRTSAGETGDIINSKLTGNLALVSVGVLKMAVDTGTSTKELAEGLYKIESAGFHGAEGLKLLRSAAEGARAEGASLETVSNTLDSAMNSFGYDVEHVNGVMNAMVQTTAHGKASMEELSSALPVVMSKAAAAGVSLQEMLGAMATMTAQGVTARQAAQNLQATISHLADQKEPARKAFASIGLDSIDLAQNLGKRGLTGTFDMVSEAITKHMGPDGLVVIKAMNDSKVATQSLKTMLGQMGPAARDLAQQFQDGTISIGAYSKAAKALPADQGNLALQFAATAKGADGFNNMLKNGSGPAQTYISMLSKMMGGSAGLNTYLELSGVHAATFAENVKAIGEAAKDDSEHVEGFNQVQKTFAFQLSQVKESAATLGISIGTLLLPYAEKLLVVLREGVGWLNEHKHAAEALAGIIGVVLAAALIKLTTSAITGAVSGIQDIAKGMRAAAIAVRDFELASKLAAAASKIMAVAQLALNLVMSANPIVLIAIGLAALVAGLIYAYNHCETFRKIVQAAFSGVKDAAVAVWHVLEAVWHGLVTGVEWVWHAIARIWDSISSVTTAVWDSIAGFFKKWWPLLLVIFALPIAILVGAWNHFHEAVFDAARSTWNAISAFFGWVWDGIVAAAKFAWDIIKLSIIDPMTWVWGRLMDIGHAIGDFLAYCWDGIKAAASAAWGFIKLAIINPALNILSTINTIFLKVGIAIGDALASAWDTVKDIGSKFWNIGRDIVMGIIHGVERAGSALYDTLRNLAGDALKSAKEFLGINSPSKLFADHVGRSIPEGIALGIRDHSTHATGAVAGLAQKTYNASTRSAFTPTLGLARSGPAAGAAPSYVLHLTVEGSVRSDRELGDLVEERMLRLGMRSPQSYPSYRR